MRMRIALAIGLVLAGVAAVAAQEYQSPTPPMPQGPIDTSSADPGQTTLPSGDQPATAQTQPQTATAPPAAASTQQK